MEVNIRGTPEEIAALVLAVQERLFRNESSGTKIEPGILLVLNAR